MANRVPIACRVSYIIVIVGHEKIIASRLVCVYSLSFTSIFFQFKYCILGHDALFAWVLGEGADRGATGSRLLPYCVDGSFLLICFVMLNLYRFAVLFADLVVRLHQ